MYNAKSSGQRSLFKREVFYIQQFLKDVISLSLKNFRKPLQFLLKKLMPAELSYSGMCCRKIGNEIICKRQMLNRRVYVCKYMLQMCARARASQQYKMETDMNRQINEHKIENRKVQYTHIFTGSQCHPYPSRTL